MQMLRIDFRFGNRVHLFFRHTRRGHHQISVGSLFVDKFDSHIKFRSYSQDSRALKSIRKTPRSTVTRSICFLFPLASAGFSRQQWTQPNRLICLVDSGESPPAASNSSELSEHTTIEMENNRGKHFRRKVKLPNHQTTFLFVVLVFESSVSRIIHTIA